MKRFLVVALLLIVPAVFGQGWPPRNGGSLPATCVEGESFFLSTSTSTLLYECTATDTWTHVTPGGEGGAWGGITGTLSDQTDLQTALDGKEPAGVAFSDLTGSATAAQLPNPGAGTKGGVSSLTCSGTDKLSAIGTDGLPVCSADETSEGGGIPAGLIVLSLAACPSGFSEVSSLAGKFVLGTTDAAGDVTDTGGSDDITEILNHTHSVSVNDPGHAHVENQNSATTGGLTGWGARDTSTNTASATSYSTASATTGITASTVNPAGGVASIDNRPAFVKVIFCSKD